MKSDPPPETAIVTRGSHAPSPLDDVELQKLWIAASRRDWRSLAIVAGSKGLATLEVANVIAKIAWWYRGYSSSVFDFRDLRLRLLEYHMRQVAEHMRQGDRAIFALRSIAENPTASPLAQAADAVILCVGIGKTLMAAAEKTIEEIGRERFIGTLILDDEAPKKKDA
jgi:hypothetical protein